MKLKRIALLFSVLLTLACGVAYEPPTTVLTPTASEVPTQTKTVTVYDPVAESFQAVVNVDSLRVHDCGNYSCDVIGWLRRGDAVSGTCNTSGWCLIDKGGYIFRGCTSSPAQFGCQ